MVRFIGTNDIKQFDVFSPRKVLINESPHVRPTNSNKQLAAPDSGENRQHANREQGFPKRFPSSFHDIAKAQQPTSSVVLINRVNLEVTNLQQLINLFSVYGNITKALSCKKTKSVWFEFEQPAQADAACRHLANFTVFNFKLKAKLSLYKELNFKTIHGSGNDNLQHMVLSKRLMRFPPNTKVAPKEITRALKVAVNADDFSLFLMFLLLSEVHEPQTVREYKSSKGER